MCTCCIALDLKEGMKHLKHQYAKKVEIPLQCYLDCLYMRTLIIWGNNILNVGFHSTVYNNVPKETGLHVKIKEQVAVSSVWVFMLIWHIRSFWITNLPSQWYNTTNLNQIFTKSRCGKSPMSFAQLMATWIFVCALDYMLTASNRTN